MGSWVPLWKTYTAALQASQSRPRSSLRYNSFIYVQTTSCQSFLGRKFWVSPAHRTLRVLAFFCCRNHIVSWGALTASMDKERDGMIPSMALNSLTECMALYIQQTIAFSILLSFWMSSILTGQVSLPWRSTACMQAFYNLALTSSNTTIEHLKGGRS